MKRAFITEQLVEEMVDRDLKRVREALRMATGLA
jgi:hypothetical protein